MKNRVYLLATIVAAGLGSLLLGYLAGRFGWIYHARTWLSQIVAYEVETTRHPVSRSEIVTAYHVLEVTQIPVGRAFHLEQVDGRIIFSTRFGQLGAIIGERAISLPAQVPLGLSELRADGLLDNPTFDINEVKVTDLLVVERASRSFDFYAAGVLYENDCFYLQVNKIGLSLDGERVALASDNWETVFRTRDCVAPQNGNLVKGSQTGGRLVRLSQDAIALSIGALGNEDRVANLDPQSDFGTVVVIPLNGGAPTTFVRGLRNPQGLFVSRTGDIWETEHGPQGGDELNLLLQDRNYGWPFVTYGMEYGGRPTPWPHSAGVSSHAGYEAARYAWLPSIGVSNLLQPDPGEFPNWANHLAVASLRDSALYLLRIEEGSVVTQERVPFPGQRIRDVINLPDGRMAVSMDAGDIYLLANADREHQGSWQPKAIDLAELDPLIPEAAINKSLDRTGANVFFERCAGCHLLFGEPGAGPPLGGLVGRRVGGHPDYAYSNALTGRDERWSADRLRRFITSPQSVYPGTAMPAPYVDFDVDRLVRYLEEQRSDPNGPEDAARSAQ